MPFPLFNPSARADTPSLADSFSRAGYLTIAPDLFAGSPAPADLNEPGWSMDEFFAENNEEVVDGRIATAVEYIQGELGIERFGVTGYCFGGRYAFRVAEAGAVFAAHPSNLLDDEISGVNAPASIAAAGELGFSSGSSSDVFYFFRIRSPFNHHTCCLDTNGGYTDEFANENTLQKLMSFSVPSAARRSRRCSRAPGPRTR